MTNLFYIIPQKFVMAILSTLFVLRIIELNASSIQISILAITLILSGLLGSTILPQIIPNIGNSKLIFITSYGGLSVAAYFSTINNINLIYISAVIASFSSQMVYYTIYLDIHDNIHVARSDVLSRLETMGGVSWIIGLITATTLSFSLPLSLLGLFTSIVALLAVISVSLNGSMRNGGELYKNTRFTSYFHRASLPHLNWAEKIIHLKKDLFAKRTRYLFISLIAIQFAISFALTHFIPYLKNLGIEDYAIFLLTVVSATASTATYSRAGRTFEGQRTLLNSLILRSLVYYLIFIAVVFYGSSLMSNYNYLLLLFLLIGVSWAYLYINISSIVIGLSPTGISYSSLMSGIGSVSGAALSGVIYSYLGYSIHPGVSIIILLIIAYIMMSRRLISTQDIPARRFIMIYQQRFIHINNR